MGPYRPRTVGRQRCGRWAFPPRFDSVHRAGFWAGWAWLHASRPMVGECWKRPKQLDDGRCLQDSRGVNRI